MKSAIFKTFFLSLCIIANVHFAYADTASILPPAKTTFVDQNGKPLAAGKVDLFIPSTTTRKATWQDAAETIPNANPVILDAAGRALILGSGSYRQVVKDRNDNIIWDQVTSSSGTGSGGSSASTGDGDLVGTIKPWAGLLAPNQYVFTYGQEISRATYSALFTALTSAQGVFCSSGSPILTGLSDTTNFPIGAKVEVSCVVSGSSTIASKTSSSITLVANSNVSTNTTATIFPWGNGNASTTFNVPDFRGFVIAGNNNMGGLPSINLTTQYFGVTNPNSIGGGGGSQSTTLLEGNIPPIHSSNAANAITVFGPDGHGMWLDSIAASNNAPGGSNAYQIGGGPAPSRAVQFSGNNAIGVDSVGTASTPFSRVQPTKTSNYIIKITPDTNSTLAAGVTHLGGMNGDIACGFGILCTGNIISNSLVIPVQPYVMPSDYGALCDGTTHDDLALQNWLTAISTNGKTGYIPPGLNCVTATTLDGGSNTTITGGGINASAIKGIGTANPVFRFVNKSNINFSDFAIIGADTQTTWAVTSIGPIFFQQNSSAIAAGEHFHLNNMKMYGFNTNIWVYMDFSASIFGFNKVSFNNLEIITNNSDIPTDPTPANNGNLWLEILSGHSGNGQVTDTTISNVRVYGSSLCAGTIMYGNIRNYTFTNNQYLDLGASTTPTHCINGFGDTYLSYGLAVYDLWSDGHPPYGGVITNNIFANPYSAGVYLAGDGNPAHTADFYNDVNTLVANNLVYGQTDILDGSLPRAGLVANSATGVSFYNNRLVNNYGCIASTAQWGSSVNIGGNYCGSDVTNAVGFRIQAGPGTSGNTIKYNMSENDISLTGAGSKAVRSFANSSYHFNEINFMNNRLVTNVSGLDLSGIYANLSIMIKGSKFSGNASTYMADASSVVGASISVNDNQFNLANSATGTGLKLDGSLANINNNSFIDRTLGAAYAFSGVATIGNLSGTRFDNVVAANQVAPTSIGLSIPTWAAQSQEFVENLNIASGNLLNLGWINTALGVNWVPSNTLSTTAALSIIGNATNSASLPTAITASVDNQVFRRSGTALAFGAVNLASSSAVVNLLPNANLANPATTVNGQTCTLGSTCTVTATASGMTIGTTTVNSGTTTRILYDNAGVLGEYTISGSGTVVAMNNGPSITGPTFLSTVTATGLIKNADLATMVTNTVKGNATSGTASPTDLSMTSCSTSASAVTWTTNTGFGCNTAIAASTATSATSATNATNATNIGITEDTTTNATMYPTWVTANTGNLPQKTTSTKLTFNPSTGVLSSTSFTGAGTGLTGTGASFTAGNVTTNANLAGAVTSSGSNTTSLGSFTSANLLSALTDETGSGSSVFGTSPILSTVDARGTWTTGTSWTLPAHTLGGTISGGGNNINNINIGVATPGTGAFTTLTTSSTATVTSNSSAATTIGPNGATSPVLQIDGSVATGTTGIKIAPSSVVPTTGVTVSAISATTDTDFVLNAKGAGIIYLASTSTGNVDIGLSGSTLNVRGPAIYASASFNLNALALDTATVDNTVCVSGTGRLLKGSGALGVCLGTSSAKFKHDIVSMGAGLAEIVKLTPRNFFYNKGYGDDGKRQQYGFVAEEVVKVIPGVTAPDVNGKPQSVDMLAMVPILVKAIQELKAEIELLKRK